MITSNLPVDEWTKTFGTKRLTRHDNILEMKGDSYRLCQSRIRKAEAST